MRRLKKPKQKKRIQKQCAPFLSLTLAASMLLSPVSPLISHAVAAEGDDYDVYNSSYNYAQTALDKLSEWGIMRGDDLGNLNPDAFITRAEFVAMINRAYGYTETGENSFQDVPENAWYADDISIARQVGYFNGTSETTAAPDDSLTREQATLLLVKNARMQTIPGEVTEFTDGREFGNWSAGYIKAAYKEGLIAGYPDGTYRPTQPITRGETAQLLYNTLGNLISSEGTHSLADVYGNVTINAPGSTLKDTTIAGDLYITGGLGLGAVTLDNVKVLGRIVVAGTGASESSQDSVILRNVDADKLIVDSITDQYLSLRAEGATVIDETSLRTGAFLRDNTDDGYGLTMISLDSPDVNAQYTLAGDLQTITNKAKESIVNVGDGVLNTLTVDEAATNSRLNLEANATVKTLNLDTGIAITGQGDIGTLNVSAAGVSTTMLPDKIEIRPGISADIAGTTMNQTTAQQSSSEPRLLAGYPKTSDVAPTTAKGLFKANKAGTVYWGVSAITDGSLTETELITPNSYKTKAVQTGNVKVDEANKEITVNITGLTTGGSYYLSAVLVDAHGKHSPVKVYSFSTPDDTVPAFSTGYPYMSLLTDKDAQVGVMTTKSCNLYYAVLSAGSVAPKEEDFRTAAIPGNLGFGVVPMTRNLPDFFMVNNQDLEELKSYDLYLWLCDADGGKSSAVQKLTFTTVDKTPPIFQTDLTINSIQANSLGAITNVNEDATVYWVIVPAGEQYPKPASGETETPALNSDFAKLQVASGMSALRSGSVNARANTDARVTMGGLQPETEYDIYYLARDTAGNYSETVKKITANTLDTIAPTATQSFNRFYGTNDTEPYANTDVEIIFSENVLYTGSGQQLIDLYNHRQDSDQTMDAFTNALRNTITLYNATGSGMPQEVRERTEDDPNNNDWVIDYRNVEIERKEKTLIVRFRSEAQGLPANRSALNLRTGSTYYFELENIADTSSARNIMGLTRLPRFTTIAAQVSLDDSINVISIPDPNNAGQMLDVDMAFSLTPISTSKVDDNVNWDMLIWMDTTSNFELYRLAPGATEWEKLPNTARIQISEDSGTQYIGQSLFRDFEGVTDNPPLKTDLKEDQEYQYAIRFTEVDGLSDRTSLSQLITGKISIVTGNSVNLGNLANNITDQTYQAALQQGVDDIGIPENFTLRKQFKDTVPPKLVDVYPQFRYGDTVLEMDFMLNRPGTIYYAVAPVGTVSTYIEGNTEPTFSDVPINGNKQENLNCSQFPYYVSTPSYSQIVNPKFTNNRIKTGHVNFEDGIITEEVLDLEPSTDYYVYIVTKGTGQIFSEKPYLFRFTTEAITRPVIELTRNNPIVTVKSDLTADFSYVLMPYNQNMQAIFRRPFSEVVNDNDKNAPIFTEHPNYLTEYTVLDAMEQNVASGNKSIGSLFDLYANQAIKDQMAEFIRTSSTLADGSTITGGGSGTVVGGRTFQIDCSQMNMKENVEYVLAVVGRSPMGSGDAFRANHPIMLNDNMPPQITNVANSLRYQPANETISGDFTLIFSEPLYYLDQTTSPARLFTVDTAPAITSGRLDGFVSVDKSVDRSGPQYNIAPVMSQDRVNSPTNALTLHCDNIEPNNYIVFLNLSDRNNNVGSGRLTVQIVLVTNRDEDGNVTYTCDVIIPQEWDARTTNGRR